MTRTITSKAPGCGTSISSTWNASLGSPSRSWRMTQAAMVSGSSPGSVSTLDTLLRSVATVVSVLARSGAAQVIGPQHTGPAEEQHGQRDAGDHAADAPDEEVGKRVDVALHP